LVGGVGEDAGEMEYGSTAAIAIRDPQLREQLWAAAQGAPVQLLGDLSELGDTEELCAEIGRARPDILLMELTGPAEFADAARALKAGAGAPRIVAVDRSADPERILAAMRAGASEYLYPPFGREFSEALARLAAECSQEHEARRPAGVAIGCVSAKGGCGATTFACHAAAFLRRARKETLLADFDWSAGMAAVYAQANSRYTLADALGSLHRIDLTLWKALVATGHDGLHVMPAPRDPMEYTANQRGLQSLLRFWRTQYEFTVVDLGSGVTTALLDLAPELDQIAVVTTAEAPALRAASQMLRALGKADCGRNRVRLVVNRALRRPPFPAAELERLLDCPVYGSVPLECGSPDDTVEIRPPQLESAMGAGMAAIASRMTGLPAETRKPRKLAFFGGGR